MLRAAKGVLGETLSAVEFLDAASMSLATSHLPGVVNPLPGPAAAFYMVCMSQSFCPSRCDCFDLRCIAGPCLLLYRWL